MDTYPVYLLRLGKQWKVVFPENKEDLGHTDFWEQSVSRLVAKHFQIPQVKLANLPYSQRRARIVGNTAYYGGRPEPEVLQAVREATGNGDLVFCFDEHERRLTEDVREFRRLVRRHTVNDRNQPRRKPRPRQ
jgi:hypothetical protein